MRSPKAVPILVFTAIVFPYLCSGASPWNPIDHHSVLFERILNSQGDTSYVARSSHFAIRLKGDGAELAAMDSAASRPAMLAMRCQGASRRVTPIAEEPSPGVLNYFTGDRSTWRTNVSGFGRIRYKEIYRGIDLVFYGSGNRLEYDFEIKPGADPSAIRVEWKGARKVTLDTNGNLVIHAPTGEVVWNVPSVWQTVGGVRKRISATFKVLGKNIVGFSVADYDRSVELVIDPTLAFSTYISGSITERARGIAVDGSGNVFVTGFTTSLDLPVTSGALQTGYAGGQPNLVSGDAFVAKYRADGSLIFMTYLGGQRDDIAEAVAVDASGNAYVAGYTTSIDFPTTPGALQTTLGGYFGSGFAVRLGDGFITKLSADGKTILYSTYLGGSSDDGVFAIAVDNFGNAYVAGTTLSTNFKTTTGAYQTVNKGTGGQRNFPLFGGGFSAMVGGDVFVSKINPAGSGLVYSTYIGGASDDVATSLAIDSSGNAYVGGYTLSRDFPVTALGFQRQFGGSEQQNFFFTFGDGFLAKLNPSGSALVYSTYVGGTGDDWISAIAVDSAGNVYATGSTTSRNFPVTSLVSQTAFGGPTVVPEFTDIYFGDAFVFKMNPNGTGPVFSTYLGGNGDDAGMAIALDIQGNIIVGGFTASRNFVTPFPPTINNSAHGFIAQLSPDGQSRTLAMGLGGSGYDGVFSLAYSSTGTVYVTGTTVSKDFPTKQAAQSSSRKTSTTRLGGDAFVAAYSGFTGNPATGPTISSVVNAASETPTIGQNTWIAIHGDSLSATTRTWQASDFINNQMPTQLSGVSVKVNGKPAFVYYIDSKQVNALTPLDSTTGQVQVQVTTDVGTSPAVSVNMQAYSPAFFLFLPSKYVAAVHLNGTYVGPSSLYPGLSFPAKPNEIISLFATGFGQTSPAIVNGSAAQSGGLPTLPTITIGGFQATVQFAGVVAPGEYQFNVIVPPGVPDGDASVIALNNGANTQSGAIIAVQR